MHTGILSTGELRSRGLSRRAIVRALDAGSLVRVRRGWFATPGAPPDLVTAARVGGRLTCLAALRAHGAWVIEPAGVHVRVADGIAVRHVAEVRLHRTETRVGPGVDSPAEALKTTVACSDLRALVAVVDSLLNRRILSRDEVQRILEATPRGRRALQLVDPAAESGIETLVRLALRRHRIRARSQVRIVGVGRVDFLVGERLVVEADGYEWHGDRSAFERDRWRDRELVRRGYLVVRASYRQVLDDLDAVITAVVEVVRRREHRWRPVHRTQLSATRDLTEA